MTEEIDLVTEDGLHLEAVLDAPADVRAGAVFCHPHPRMGGTMNAPLMLAVRDELVSRAWGVLRFNFRGIGRSEGESGTGVAEIADARAALAYVRRRHPGLPVAVVGWSFGAAVAVRAAVEDHHLTACACIAPPIRPRTGITIGLPARDQTPLDVPTLFVCGTNDHLVRPDDCSSWGGDEGTVRVVVLQGANHLFWGKYEEVAATVAAFLEEETDGGRDEGGS